MDRREIINRSKRDYVYRISVITVAYKISNKILIEITEKKNRQTLLQISDLWLRISFKERNNAMTSSGSFIIDTFTFALKNDL